MLFDDESKEVVIAALRTMLRCDAGSPEAILPLAASEDKCIRAAAIAALTKHSCQDAPRWFERGLKDREACVRLETAALLPQLEPNEHRDLFELALYDPNPEVARIAQKLTARKGYDKVR
jgi:HEAT repeat protein